MLKSNRMAVTMSALCALLVVIAGTGLVCSPAALAQPVVLKSYWGPKARRSSGPVIAIARSPTPIDHWPQTDDAGPIWHNAPPSNEGDPAPASRRPAESHSIIKMPFSGLDPMIAVGRNYMIYTQQSKMLFLDKNGAPLPAKNGVASTQEVASVFGRLADGSGSAVDLNAHSGFTTSCKSRSYPKTSGQKYCITDFYDLRAYFDPGANRFLLLAQVRNPLWTDIWSSNKQYMDEFGVCGLYGGPINTNKVLPVPTPAHCGLARRHAVFAISRTEDPRDGFHTYAITENNYQDWPWGAVNAEGDTFVVGHRGNEMPTGMSAMVFRLSDLREGKADPAYFKLYAAETNGFVNPAAIVHHGAGKGLGGLTVLASSGRVAGTEYDRIALTGFSAPTGQGAKPSRVSVMTALPEVDLPSNMQNTIYRNGALHMAWQAGPGKGTNGGSRIGALRVPLRYEGGALIVSQSPGDGYRSAWIGKDSRRSQTLDDLDAAIATNADGDTLYAYSRASGEQVAYTIWPANANEPGPEIIVHSRANPDYAAVRVDYAWAAVDPADDKTFWFAHNGKKADGSHETLLVRVTP